jgi:hypothetical protein
MRTEAERGVNLGRPHETLEEVGIGLPRRRGCNMGHIRLFSLADEFEDE